MSEEMFEFEMDPETAEGFNAFMDAVRENYEMAVAHAELMTQGMLFLMRTHDISELVLDEADAGLVVTDMEDKNLVFNMDVDPGEDGDLWKIIYTIKEHEEEAHPSVG